MKKLLTFLIFTCLCVANIQAALVLGDEITSLDQIKDGTTSFVMKNSEGQFMCFTENHNASMQDQATALSSKAFLFKLESLTNNASAGSSIKDKYLIRTLQSDGSAYSPYGSNYLNSSGSVIFTLGLTGNENQYSFGQDKNNGAVWDVTYTSGSGFSFKNVGDNKYMNNAGSTSDTQGYWKLYKVKEGSSSSNTFSLTTQDDSETAKCTITQSNGIYTYTTTSGYSNILFKNKNITVSGYNQFKIVFDEETTDALYFSDGNKNYTISAHSKSYTYDIADGTTSLSEITLVYVGDGSGTGKTFKISSAELTNGAGITHTITVNGTERSYDLYIPDGVGENPALIFSLHGASGHSSDYSPFGKSEADSKKCIVVYPQGLNQNFGPFGTVPGWDATGEKNVDYDFFKAILNDVKNNHHAYNAKKVYCCGFSNGGMMTYAMANAASDIFAAYAAISGFPMNEFHHTHHGASPRPFLHIHGSADNFVDIQYMPTIRDNMVARLGANPVPTTTVVDGSYTKYEYAAGTNGFPYTYYVIDGMGHSGFTTKTPDGNSTLTMWKFFNQYTLDDACDATLKWYPNLDMDGFTPSDHGWTVTNNTTFKYGDATPTANPNVSHSLQFEKGDYQLRFQTTGTAGNKITINLKKVDGTEVFTKEATVGQKQYISYNIPSYDEYTITITKASASDKFSSLGAYMTTAAWDGATEVGEEGNSVTPTPTNGEDLTSGIFHKWNGTDATATVEEQNPTCTYTLNESTGQIYGDAANVNCYYYADLSDYGRLVVTAPAGEPRFCFNRQPNDNNNVELEFPRDKESKAYETITTNADGSKTYTINLEAIVTEYGYAHLNAIKGANWANVTVTSMKLYPVDNCLKVTTTGAQTNVWDWQIRYPLPTALEKDKIYTIEMVAKAGAAVDIQPIAAYNASSNKDEWGGTADIQYLGASITTDWSTVSFETNGNYPYDYLYFNIGKVNGDFLISNLKITEKSSGTVILDNNMNDNSTWTKTQDALTLATVSASESATSGTSSTITSNPNYPMGAIRQKGKNLVCVDDESTPVVLHGVMDTPSAYFQGGRWTKGVTWADYNNTTTNIPLCLDYFNKEFAAITNKEKGTYCNLFRLHLDPCWLQGTTLASDFSESDGTIKDPHGNAVSGEANIGKFSLDKFKARLQDLYIPIIKDAIAHGLYVIIRPPGVFPHEIVVGDYYNTYLQTIWDVVSNDSYIKANPGYISLELGNEPVHIWPSGTTSFTNYTNSTSALADFFQPIVNKIRSNGFDGIIWAPGTGWQAEYSGYNVKMLTDSKNNLGFAAHFYPGWYGTTGNDDTPTKTDEQVLAQFKSQVPVQANYPIVITEVDWSPKDGAGGGHYNESGTWVVSNLGTWGTGSTSTNSRFGEQYKYVMDQCGNISWTIEGADLYVDMDAYLEDGTVQPAFRCKSTVNNVDVYESCSGAAFKWFKEYAGGTTAWEPDNSKNYHYISTGQFHHWDKADATAAVTTTSVSPALNRYTATEIVYGNSNVNYLEYADLSKYGKLSVTATAGTPRFFINMKVDGGTAQDNLIQIPSNADQTTAYQTTTNNSDGSVTYTIDLAKIVADQGFAHLHAIKGVQYGSTVTVSNIKLYAPYDPFAKISLEQTLTTSRSIVLVNDNKVMNGTWGEYNDNGQMHSKDEFTQKYYQLKIEPVTIDGVSNTYTIKLNENGKYTRYLQASKWGHAFFNATYGDQKGNDGANCAVWVIEEISDGKYSIRSLGVVQDAIRADDNDGYLCVGSDGQVKINSTTAVGWEFNTYDDSSINVSVAATRKFGSFSSIYNVDFSDANSTDMIAAYTVTYTSGSNSVKLTRHRNVLPAGTGVVLYAPTDTKSWTFATVAETNATVADNDMVGVPVAKTVPASVTEGGTTYYSYGLSGDAFHPLTSTGTIPAGKAYLSIPRASSSSAKAITIGFDDSTGIEEVNREDGFFGNGKVYNLQGVEMNGMMKNGIYIINGKKVLVK